MKSQGNFNKQSKNKLIDNKRLDALYYKVSGHINNARNNIQKSIDIEIVKTYWLIGKEIVEEEQQGLSRAKYGKALILGLGQKLKEQYGKGFSETNIKNMRQFYLEYQANRENYSIRYAVRSEFEAPDFLPNLGWTHYRALMRIDRLEARAFYEIEASRNHWSARELERQIGSLLFDRLSKSKDKKGLMKLANSGHEIAKPEDAIKDPLVLEFLGLPESHRLVESKLEEALINNLQQFLLELGKGFAFIARQKRLTLDSDHFYADLVFYHVILKCFVIIDLKTRKLNHADLGQMLLYVNYFDQEVKAKDDNPTIGLVLCTDKSNTMVKYTLGEKGKQIFASKYQFHLPTEAELEKEIKREVKAIKEQI